MHQLYSRLTDGSGEQITLNNALTANEYVIPNFALNGDGSLVAFLVDTDLDGYGNELFSSSIHGGGATLLASTANDITSFAFAGDTIVVLADFETAGAFELFTVPVPVPEPSTYGMLGLASLAFLYFQRKRRRNAA